MDNIYKNYSNEELCNVIKDIINSKKEDNRVESFVPYAQDIKNNINGNTELITLSAAIDIAKQNFYTVLCERFLEIIEK